MSTEVAEIRQALVYRSHEYPHRWYDALGEGVSKYVQDFVSLPADDTTTDPDEWVDTVVEGGGTSSAVLTDVSGGALLITCAGDANDGYSMQLGNANSGEWVDFSSPAATYFGIRFQLLDADQTRVFFGVAPTDTTLNAGVTDGVYFRSAATSAVLNFVTETGSVEGTDAVGTMVDATDITAEYYCDGTTLTSYINGVETSSKAVTDATFPDTALMRLSLEVLSDEGSANTCTIKWLRLIQIR